jgi:hypothetical protein
LFSGDSEFGSNVGDLLSFGEFSLDEFLMVSLGVFGGNLGGSDGVLSDFSVDFGHEGFQSLDFGGGQHLGDT